MASKKPTPPKRISGKGPVIPPKPSRKQIEAVIEEIREQCFGEDEEAVFWSDKLTEELDLPFKALLMPESGRRNAPPRPVEVLNISEGEEGPIAEVRLGDGTEVPVRLKDLIPVDAAEDTILLLHAYREWVKGRDDFEEDDDFEDDDDFDDDDDDDDDDEWEEEEVEDLALETVAVPDVLDDDLDEFPEIDEAIEGEAEEEEEEEEDEFGASGDGAESEDEPEDDDDLPRSKAAKKGAAKKGGKEEPPAKPAKKGAKPEPVKPAAKKAAKEEPPAKATKKAVKEEPPAKSAKKVTKPEPVKPAAKKVVKEEPPAKAAKPAAKKPAAKPEPPKKPAKKR